jgi:hypothetical protein
MHVRARAWVCSWVLSHVEDGSLMMHVECCIVLQLTRASSMPVLAPSVLPPRPLLLVSPTRLPQDSIHVPCFSIHVASFSRLDACQCWYPALGQACLYVLV